MASNLADIYYTTTHFSSIDKKFYECLEEIASKTNPNNATSNIQKSKRGQNPNENNFNNSFDSCRSDIVDGISLIFLDTYEIFAKKAQIFSTNKSITVFTQAIEAVYKDTILEYVFSKLNAIAEVTQYDFVVVEKFYENFICGYKLFNLRNKLNKLSLPKYKLLEFINLNPLQRLFVMNFALQESFDVDIVLQVLQKYIRLSANFGSVKILLKIFELIKVYASYYLFNDILIRGICATLNKIFCNFQVFFEDKDNHSLLCKLLKKITKILIYFSFYYNDMSLSGEFKKYLLGQDQKANSDKGKYVYANLEIPRTICENLIQVSHFVELEYNKGDNNQKEKYQSILDLIHILLNINYTEGDYYSCSIKRLIDPHLETTALYLINELTKNPKVGAPFNTTLPESYAVVDEHFISNISILNKECNELNKKISAYYTTSTNPLMSNKHSIEDNGPSSSQMNLLKHMINYFERSLTKLMDYFHLKKQNNSNDNGPLIKDNNSMLSPILSHTKTNNLTDNEELISKHMNTINKDEQSNNNIDVNSMLLQSNKKAQKSPLLPNNSQTPLVNDNKNSKKITNLDSEMHFNASEGAIESGERNQSQNTIVQKHIQSTRANNENDNGDALRHKSTMGSVLKPNANSESKNTYDEFSLSYYIFTLSKLFPIVNTNKELIPFSYCDKLITLINTYLRMHPEHAVFMLHKDLFVNLSEMPRQFLPQLFTLFKTGIKFFIETKCVLKCGFIYLKTIYEIFITKVPQNNLSIYTTCLSKLLRIIHSLLELTPTMKKELASFIKDHFFSNVDFTRLIKSYKDYLIELGKDYEVNPEPYKIQKAAFQNDIYNRYYPNIRPKTMHNIFLYFIKIVTTLYNGISRLSQIEFIQNFITAKELMSITSLIPLDIQLRVEVIKLFRITYIDMLIDETKLNLYRNEFQKDIEERMGENLFPPEQRKIFMFYDMLMDVNNQKISDEEYDFLLFEVTHFSDIITYSNVSTLKSDKEQRQMLLMEYFEEGVILPLVIFLNKVFSTIASLTGEEQLRIFQLTTHILEMIKVYSELSKENGRNLNSNNEDNTINNNNNNNVIIINEKKKNKIPQSNKENKKLLFSKISKTLTKVDEIDLINRDLNLLRTKTSPPMNYYNIYQILAKHLMTIFANPQIKSSYLDTKDETEENKLEQLKQELENKDINIESNSYMNSMFNVYTDYFNDKSNYKRNVYRLTSFRKFGMESMESFTYGTILCKYLLVTIADSSPLYSKEALDIMLMMLKSDTFDTQSKLSQVLSKHEYLKKMEIIIENAYANILTTIMSLYNPALVQFSDDYELSVSMIRFFKFLCEEHNQHFQRFFMKQSFFKLCDIQRMSFYDMMLFILEKIIVLSCWEQVKHENDFHHYFVPLFSAVIDLLIEIVQGTEDSNFLTLINQKFEGNQLLMLEANRFDPVLKKGKAFEFFLHSVKGLVISGGQCSKELEGIRKLLLDFFLAFMEESHCPMQIKNMIISNFQASNIIDCIAVMLKKMYKEMLETEKINHQLLNSNNSSNSNNNNTNNNNSGNHSSKGNTLNEKSEQAKKEEKLRRRRTMIFVDSHYTQTRKDDNHNTKTNSSTLSIFQRTTIFLNKTISKVFRELYFVDETLAESSTFLLCCAMYNYFKLSLLQCKDEQTIAFWKKIQKISKEDKQRFNTLTSPNDSMKNEINTYEAYYVIKIFEVISRSVLVKINKDKPPMYVIYAQPPCVHYISNQSKNDFLASVDRSCRETKLFCLVEQTKYLQIEAEHNFEHLRNRKFLRKLTTLNYYWISLIVFLVDLVLNCYFAAVSHEHGINSLNGNVDYLAIRILSLLCCVIVILIIVLWCYTKLPLFYKIEAAKYIEKHTYNEEDEVVAFKWHDKGAIILKSVFAKGELNSLLLFLLFRILGSINASMAFLYPFSLLGFISLTDKLKLGIIQFFQLGKILVWFVVLTVIILYIFAGWGFYYLRDMFYDTTNREIPENLCESLFSCFLNMIINGLRWYPGIGKVLVVVSPLTDVGSYVHHYIYHYVFYVIIRLIIVKLLFGMVYTVITQLTQIRRSQQIDAEYRCFICNTEKDECENRGESFKDHCEKLHSVWDYANYMIMLRMTDLQDLNAANSTCKEMLEQRNINWMPCN